MLKCVCNSGFGGETCDCPTDIGLCKSPSDANQTCSGRGDCVCGKCKCKRDTSKFEYLGAFCENYKIKEELQHEVCEEHFPCVECALKNEKKCSCNNYNITIFENLSELPMNNEQKCEKATVECPYAFYFQYNEAETTIINIRARKGCSTEINYILIYGVVTSLIVGGLVAIVFWRCVIEMHDRREYAKFMNEQVNASWTLDNPLYQNVVGNFQNPTFELR
jgi:hypothetical protein